MSQSFFTRKVAVVTGAGGTLCSAVAKDLAAQGAKVALIGRSAEKLQPVAEEILAAGGVVKVYPGDVTEEARMQEIADAVKADLGLCTLLINGAGGNNSRVMTKNEEFVPEELAWGEEATGFFNLDLAAFQQVLVTNTLGSVIPARIFARHMIEAGEGSILNFASMNSYCPLTKVPAYAMAKAGVTNFTQWLAGYLAPAGIRVNAVAPGFFANERSVRFLGSRETGFLPRGQKVIDHTPAARFGSPEDLLGTVRYLLDSNLSAFVTGITVPVDGGFLTRSGV